MVARVLISSTQFNVSRPGFSAAGSPPLDSLLMSLRMRTAQILEHGTLTLDSSRHAEADIGPYASAPDVYYQIITSDNILRLPPAVFGNNGQHFYGIDSGTVVATRLKVTFDMSNFGFSAFGDVLYNPAKITYLISRRGAIT